MSTGGRPPSCVPTWHGHIETTKDALLVFEACFQGVLHHCSRRPHDRERNQLIVSGNVFVYEEATSGIKRWTDGIPWSPSRILTNFLIYRQLNSPFPPGEKKRATKRSQRPSRPGEPYSTPTSSSNTPAIQTPSTEEHKAFAPESPETPSLKETPGLRKEDDSPDKDSNRGLVGSLVDSYEFKEDGLLKKTMTVTVRNVQHHLVSYYSLEDAKYNLKTPREDDRIKNLPISEALLKQPKFKFPNLDDAGDGSFESLDGGQGPYHGYYPVDQSRAYTSPHHPYPYSNALQYSHPGVYAPSHPPAATAGYATMPPTGSLYAPMTPTSQYPQHAQHHQHQQQHQHQHQHQPHHQPQSQSQPQHPPQQHQHQHQQYQQYYQAHGQSQYHPGYPQQYQAHQAPVQPQPGQNAPVKPESSASHYSYGGPPQSEAVGELYGSHGANGTTAPPQPESGLPATTQPQQSQTWPLNSGYNSAWGARPESSGYPPYRPAG